MSPSRSQAVPFAQRAALISADPQSSATFIADTITLVTLAPTEYYSQFDLMNFASELDRGICEFGKGHGLSLEFDFCQLGTAYEPGLKPENVRAAVDGRSELRVAV